MSAIAVPAVLIANYALLFVAVCALGFVSLRRVKAQGDVVRKGFAWYHAVFWLFFVGSLLGVVAYSILIAYYTNDAFNTGEALIRISSLSELFFLLASTALLFCISELAIGVKRAVKQERSKGFRIYIIVLSSLVALFVAGYYIYDQYRLTLRFRSAARYAGAMFAFGLFGLLAVAALLIGNLSVAIFAAKQRRAAKNHAGGLYRKAAGFVVLAACLNLALFVWNILAAVLIGLSPYFNSQAWAVADAIISHWGTIAILVVIYLLGKKEAGGLWSTPANKTGDAPEVGGAYVHQQAYAPHTSHV